MTMRELQAWADSLTTGRRVRITTVAAPVLSAFSDWACIEDAAYDQPYKRI